MEYNANLVQSAWMIMNSPTSSPEQKQQSNTYLTEFKQTTNFLKITNELFLCQDINMAIFSAFIINQHIRDNISSLIESKESFDAMKQLLFNELMPKLELSLSNYPELVIQRICLSSAVIAMVGSVRHWQISIEELIQYANGSYIKCYYVLTILANMNLDVSSVLINQKDSTMIREQLKAKRDIMLSFIMSIVNSLSSIKDNDIRQKLQTKTIESITTWVKYSMNILQVNSLCEIMLSQIKPDTIKEVSEMFSDCISNTKGAKVYTFDSAETISDCLALINKDEMSSLNKIIGMIFNFISNYVANTNNIKQTDNDDSLLIGIANIFSSISENYLYLFFTKDNLARQLLEVLLWFISLNKRKVSYKFFETISEMREFINNKYKLSNFSTEDKKDFGLYLMKIAEGVMINSKLKSIDANYNCRLRNELLYVSNPNIGSNKQPKMIVNESVNEKENDPNEVSVIDYRKSADDVFYNIFFILVQNYSMDGASLFLSQIQKIITYADINNESVASDQDRLLAIEAVFFIMMSIIESYEQLQISLDPILNFTQCIIQSKLLLNETMVMIFLLFIDKAAAYIQKNKNVYQLTILFLFDMIKMDKANEEISSHWIHNMNMFIEAVDIEMFNVIYQYYNENYSNASKTVCMNLTLALCHAISVKRKDQNNDDDYDCNNKTILPLNELKHYYLMIMIPSTKNIKQLHQYLSNSNMNTNNQNTDNQELILSEINKNYSIHHTILFRSSSINKALHNELFSIHFTDSIATTKIIFELYSNKSDLIKELSVAYVKHIEKLGYEECMKYFAELNTLMISALKSNDNNYQCLNVLKLLYNACLINNDNKNNANDKQNLIADLFFSICREQSKSVLSNSKNRIDILKLYSQFFYYVFRHLNFSIASNVSILSSHKEDLIDSIRIFSEAISSYNNNSLSDSLINALSCFISHETLPSDIIKDRCADIIIRVFNALDSFNTSTIQKVELFVSSAIAFNKELFLSTLQMIFDSNESFKSVFNGQSHQLIISFLNLFSDDDNKVHSLISYMINIKQGKMKLDRLNYIAIEIHRRQSMNQ